MAIAEKRITFATLDSTIHSIEHLWNDEPDWLADVSDEPSAEESAPIVPRAAEEAEIPDWLSPLDTEADQVLPSTAEEEFPDWMQSPSLPMGQILGSQLGEETSPDWLQDLKPETKEVEEWLVGMSDDFVRSLRRVDKKLKGRILDAMTHICRSPITPQGNTVKPLHSDLKGLWRYRIGDFRLVYQPNVAQQSVMLLTFDSRSSVYR
ncbi:MAG: type II toxin-antitoxin system RelE/ParE family toxin [Anaerolineae bacterium]|nr:type II toxin-antitoxin system RelE/ParE family toxin [Anaerolineae bacterium]